MISLIVFVISLIILILTLYYCYNVLKREMLTNLDRRAVFITGCDSGFGRGLAVHLDNHGVPVFAGCLTKEGIESLQNNCSKKLTPIELDLTKDDSVQKAREKVQEKLRNSNYVLWGVVNNAGILGHMLPTEMYTMNDFRTIMDVNFFGQVAIIQSFLSLLKQSKGRLVNMASVAGVCPFATLGFPTPYVPSKFAVVGYTEALMLDLKKWGISVSLICPGGHKTELSSIDRQIKDTTNVWENLPKNVKDEYGHDWIDKCCSELKKLYNLSIPGPEKVIDAYTHALFAVYPNRRYLVGPDAYMYTLVNKLPYKILHAIIWMPIYFLNIPLPAILKRK